MKEINVNAQFAKMGLFGKRENVSPVVELPII